MTIEEQDPILTRLSRLATAEPDETHLASVRARCHAALARRRRGRSSSPSAASRRWLPEAAALGVLALAYLAVVLRAAVGALTAS